MHWYHHININQYYININEYTDIATTKSTNTLITPHKRQPICDSRQIDIKHVIYCNVEWKEPNICITSWINMPLLPLTACPIFPCTGYCEAYGMLHYSLLVNPTCQWHTRGPDDIPSAVCLKNKREYIVQKAAWKAACSQLFDRLPNKAGNHHDSNASRREKARNFCWCSGLRATSISERCVYIQVWWQWCLSRSIVLSALCVSIIHQPSGSGVHLWYVRMLLDSWLFSIQSFENWFAARTS